MDDLSSLRQFRADVLPAPRAREQAHERLQSFIVGRRRRRPGLIALVAAGALLLALGGTAYGLAREYLLGDPAPDPVKEQATMLNKVKGELIPKARTGPGVQAEQTKLAAFLDASTGPVYLWVAPAERGGPCLFMQIVGTEMPDGRPNLSGGCGRGGRTIDWGTSGTRVRDRRFLMLVSGIVSGEVARLDLKVDGRTDDVPLQGGFFIAELPGSGTNEASPEIPSVELTAYDGSGRELARAKSRPPFHGQSQRPKPIDLSSERPLLEITTRRTGKPIRLYLVERDGERCRVLVSPGGTSSGCGGRSPDADEIAVAPNQIGSAPDGMLLLWGEVGSAIARLELHFEDGRIEQLPLTERFTLYQVDPGDFAAGRRPLKLTGRDESGREIGERELGPWQP